MSSPDMFMDTDTEDSEELTQSIESIQLDAAQSNTTHPGLGHSSATNSLENSFGALHQPHSLKFSFTSNSTDTLLRGGSAAGSVSLSLPSSEGSLGGTCRPHSPDDHSSTTAKKAKQDHSPAPYSIKASTSKGETTPKKAVKRPMVDEKATPIGPPSQRKMLAGDVGESRHKNSPHKQRHDERYDRPSPHHHHPRGSPKKHNRKHSDLVATATAAIAAAGSSVRQEPRGTPLSALTRMCAAQPGVPGVAPSRQHEVLVQLPVPQGQPPLPYPALHATEDLWDQYHVRMPCSPSSLYPRDSLPSGYPDTGSSDTVPRWNVIKWALSQPLRSVADVQRAIVSYNSRYHDKWLLNGLQAVVEEFSEEEEDQFFSNTLPGMCRLAQRLPELVTRTPSLLIAHRNKSVTLSQLQIASLLANAFFCTFPRRNAKGYDTEYAHFPEINFSKLLNADGHSVLEKIKCLLNYFRVVTTTEPVGLVTFARHMMENAPAVVWQQCMSPLPKLHCDDGGMIEEATGLLQVDFANRFLGGGVLGHGCVQEEIRFMLCPELLTTRLLAEALDKTEAIVVIGVEQYNRGTGYANSFVFAGRHEDTTPRDSFGRRMCQLTAIDAVHFRARPAVQFSEELVIREINKAYAGFCALEGTVGDLPAVATGNWGCGAFRGNPQLKALLQMAACGYAGRDIAYFTFLDSELKNRIADMHEFLIKGGVTVGALVQGLCQYGSLSREVDGSDLYHYLYHNFRDPSRTPSPGDSPRPADQGPQQIESPSETPSGSSWGARSREMNGNGNSFNGTNGKNGTQKRGRGKETLANNSRLTDFFPRLPSNGSRRGDTKNGADSLTATGNVGVIASVHKPSSSPPSKTTAGSWDDGSPKQEATPKGKGNRDSRNKRNRGRGKEGLTDQQIVDAITEPDRPEEKGDGRGGEKNGAGAGEEFTSSSAKRGRKKRHNGNRKNVPNVNDRNGLISPSDAGKGTNDHDRRMNAGPDEHGSVTKTGVDCY